MITGRSIPGILAIGSMLLTARTLLRGPDDVPDRGGDKTVASLCGSHRGEGPSSGCRVWRCGRLERAPDRLLRLLTRVWHERAGEPVITGIDPSTAPDLLTESGWTVKEILPAPTLQTRYLDSAELPFRFTHAGTLAINAIRAAPADQVGDGKQ